MTPEDPPPWLERAAAELALTVLGIVLAACVLGPCANF